MLALYRELISLTIDSDDGTDHKVADLFIRDRDLRLSHLVVEFDGVIGHLQAVFSRAAFAMPDVAAGRWPVRERVDAGAPQGARDGVPPWVASLLGPHGAVIGPEMIPETMLERDPEGGHSARLRSAGQWLDARVTAADGAVGMVADVIFDLGRDAMIGLAVADGPPGSRHAVPAELIREIDWSAAEVRVACPAALVASSPGLPPAADAQWWAGVRIHYNP